MRSIQARIPEDSDLWAHLPKLIASGPAPSSLGKSFLGRQYLVFEPYAEHIGREDSVMLLMIQLGCEFPVLRHLSSSYNIHLELEIGKILMLKDEDHTKASRLCQ